MWTESAKDQIFKLNKYSTLHAFAEKNFANKRIYGINQKTHISLLKRLTIKYKWIKQTKTGTKYAISLFRRGLEATSKKVKKSYLRRLAVLSYLKIEYDYEQYLFWKQYLAESSVIWACRTGCYEYIADSRTVVTWKDEFGRYNAERLVNVISS